MKEDKRIDLSDGVKLYDNEGVEIVSWTLEEWTQEPFIVPSIISAVQILLTEGPDALKDIVGK